MGMMTVHHQADAGIFVTTSTFTAPAAALARRHGITLFDGGHLRQLVGNGRRAPAREPWSDSEASGEQG